MITEKSCRSKITQSTQCKENYIDTLFYRETKPQIQERQVNNNRPKLGRGRAGMQYKQLQPVADILVSSNKSPNIPTTQEVTINSTKYPVPNQLITHRTEIPTTSVM